MIIRHASVALNAVFRSEPIAKAKHGTKAHIVKAFRRHVCQDIQTGLPITCPLGPSNSTSSHILEQTVHLINRGLDRVSIGPLAMVVADRFWSNEPTIRAAQKINVGLLTWTRDDPSVKKALAQVSDAEWYLANDSPRQRGAEATASTQTTLMLCTRDYTARVKSIYSDTNKTVNVDTTITQKNHIHSKSPACSAGATNNCDETNISTLGSVSEQVPQTLGQTEVEINNSQKSEETTYYLDTKITIYKLQQPIRAIAHWNGDADSKKLAALAVGLAEDKYKATELLEYLPFRQRVEILIKGLQRRVQLANFCGGQAIIRQEEVTPPSPSDEKRWQKNKKQVQTRQKNAKATLVEIEKELEQLESHPKAKPTNSLALCKNELKKLARSFRGKIEGYTKRLEELAGLLAWASGEAEAPAKQQVAELDLTREALLTQMKLDVFTAQETLVNEFINLALKPVLYEEAKQQALKRKQFAKRSNAKNRQGELLDTDVEQLYQTKLANLERETILLRLLNQPGEFLLHHEQRLILSVFKRFDDKRMQAAFERYSLFLNQQALQIRLDDGPPWHLLFTYHTLEEG